MSLQASPMQVYPFRNKGSDIEGLGIIDLHRSDSSVYSEKPEAWVCPKCSYVNVDGRNIFCAMCGTQNENKVLLEETNVIPQEGEIVFSAGSTDSMDLVSECGLGNSDVRLLGANSGEEDFRSNFEKSLGVPALNVSSQRPGMEDGDADDEAQPLKPSTGRSEYWQHEGASSICVDRRPSATQTDDSSVMHDSFCSSVATVTSMSSAMATSVASSTAMAGSVASSTATPRISNKRHVVVTSMPAAMTSSRVATIGMTGSVASSTATPRISNKALLPPEKISNDTRLQSDISVASSAVTEKVSNTLSVPIPLDTMSEENTTPTEVHAGIDQDRNTQTLLSIPSNPTIALPRAVKSGIYSIEEEENAIVPPFMRALSMPMRPQESDANSTMSEPQKPVRTEDWAPTESVALDSESFPVTRKESESSQFTQSTAGRTSIVSLYNDEPSPKVHDLPRKMMPRATALPLHHNRSMEGDDEEGRDNLHDNEKRAALCLFGAGSLVILIAVVLMVILIPPNPQHADFNLPTFALTLSPSAPEKVVGDSTTNVALTPIPSPAPTVSPVLTASPTTVDEDDSVFLLGKLEGVEDSRRMGHSVSLGGIDGDVVAFVGVGAVRIAKFATGTRNWSSIETINTLEENIPDTAKVSLSTEMNRVALAYNGKLEYHEYSPSDLKWIRELDFNDALGEPTANHTAVSMSGDGMFIAFLHPVQGLQMMDLTADTEDGVSTTTNVILQVELSLNGKLLAVLTENGVELKVPSPSGIWENLAEPITDVKRATAIALSGNGETLVITSRTHTVLYSLNAGDDESSSFTIAQGGIELSIDFDGDLLAIGKSSDMLNADQTFTTVSLYRKSIRDQPPPFEYDFFEDIELGDMLGASLSLLTTKNTIANSTKIAVGAPLDGRKQQGSVRLYQVQNF
ncbi:MAG: hypothetical protein SGBAC_004254 [Bacillariaceae sp.]